MGINPKELNQDEPFCKSTYPNRKAVVNVFFLLFLIFSRKKTHTQESSQAPEAAVLPCSLFAVGSSSLACPWNPTVDPPARHLAQVSIAHKSTQTRAQSFVHEMERQKCQKR